MASRVFPFLGRAIFLRNSFAWVTLFFGRLAHMASESKGDEDKVKLKKWSAVALWSYDVGTCVSVSVSVSAAPCSCWRLMCACFQYHGQATRKIAPSVSIP